MLRVRTNAEAKANGDYKLHLVELENGELLDDDQHIRISRQVTATFVTVISATEDSISVERTAFFDCLTTV